MPELDLVRRKDVLQSFGITDQTLRDWVQKFNLPFIKVGRTIRFRRADILKFTAQHAVNSEPATA
jgi:excisionase family DNA binding protein